MLRDVRQLRAWPRDLSRWRSLPLLAALLTLLAVGPLLDEQLAGFAVWQLLFTLTVLSAMARLAVGPGPTLLAGLLAVPTMASLWLRQFIPDVGLSAVGLGLLTLFLLATAAVVLVSVFREERVTLDTLSGAFCVYLLFGFACGTLYGVMYLRSPGAFHLPAGWTPRHESGIAVDVPFNLLTYFSFMTLTTVGYGDVLPIADASRAVAALEAVLGHFYLAILVARLVGLHAADTRGHQ